VVERPIGSAPEFAALLAGIFQIDEPRTDAIWEHVREITA